MNKEHKEKKYKTERNQTENRKLRMKGYNTSQWQKISKQYKIEHPLCEECLKQNRVTPVEEVHHKKSFVHHGAIDYDLLYDFNNLESVCKLCHAKIHNHKEKTALDIIKELDELFGDEDK